MHEMNSLKNKHYNVGFFLSHNLQFHPPLEKKMRYQLQNNKMHEIGAILKVTLAHLDSLASLEF